MTSEVATNVATHDDPDAPSPHWAKTLPIIVGVAMSHEPDFPGLVDQFTGITPENCMKMAHIQPTEGTFRWKEADALVDFAASRKMAAHGHTLVWATDERTPEWVFRDGDKPASRPLVLERLRTHIIAVVGRYRGRVGSWDVVNEALADGHGGYLRRSGWTSLVGPDFIAQAFAWAREADPAAELYYNDYGIEAPQKREKLLRLLRDLIASGAPITAVGIQGHWEVSRVPLADLDALLESVGALGLQAAISELDIGLVPRAVWFTSDGKQRDALKDVDALAAGAPAESLDTQARAYADVFRVACRRSRCVRRVTLWGLHDGVSWLNQWPWKRTEHPLLFDRRGAPKPALKAIAAVCASLTVEESGPSIPTAAHVDASAAAMPPLGGEWEAFRGQGKRMVDEIADYYAALKSGHLLTRSSVKPGYLHAVLPKHAPEAPEAFDAVLADVHAHIIPGVTHWQSPSFFSYFPAQTSAAGLLGDMLSTAISCVGFSWAASPACTELETITTDWLAELIGLPPDFQSAGAGGGVIQGSASEATLVALLAARARALAQATRPAGAESDEALTARLVFYASDQAHSSAKKAAMVAGVMPGCFRSIASDPRTRAVSVEALVAAMAEDQAAGRVPCFVLATLGTTSSGAFDDLRGVVAAARPHAAWVHVDAAWAGSAFVCPELRAGRLDGVEGVDSLDFNPHKWLRVPFDCRWGGRARSVCVSDSLEREITASSLLLQRYVCADTLLAAPCAVHHARDTAEPRVRQGTRVGLPRLAGQSQRWGSNHA